ncbi:KilA-N domain-containing protein [Imhoffiella purpurea]|uniref:Phage-related protein n=1 Tax=Imhoffiella purpurea TaxID=1249627 RepID=W9V8S1_9GAMM|nr:KilA-N domain-containing protein [Imhoffiella purpurea]EXJ15998.1 Phage-related protein [Imhoffiella purpurea]
MPTNTLVVADVTVRQDSQGRFNLNDLHTAAGGLKKHQPSNWLRSEQAVDLIAELDIPGIPGVSRIRGRSGGTFVVKELVYAYAMWISPKFHLEVIRSYDRLATKGVAVHHTAAEDVLNDPLKYMGAILDQARELQVM